MVFLICFRIWFGSILLKIFTSIFKVWPNDPFDFLDICCFVLLFVSDSVSFDIFLCPLANLVKGLLILFYQRTNSFISLTLCIVLVLFVSILCFNPEFDWFFFVCFLVCFLTISSSWVWFLIFVLEHSGVLLSY